MPLASNRVRVGERVAVGFRLNDPLTGEAKTGVEDVVILALGTTGNWQQRQPADEVEPGVYTTRFVPPRDGVYYVFVEALSLGIRSNHNRYLVLQASAASEAVAATEAAGTPGDEGRRR